MSPRIRYGRKTILSLCDGLGSWSQPYVDAGYNVIRVELMNGQDVRLFRLPRDEQDRPIKIHGVLAAPPCTVFGRAGMPWVRTDQEMIEALGVVDACLRVVFATKPRWWALENPFGRLGRWIGPPVYRFHPWQFGDGYYKETWLWGNFAEPVPTVTTPPPRRQRGRHESSHDYDLALVNGRTRPGVTRQMLRAQTPPGFAEAFFKANP